MCSGLRREADLSLPDVMLVLSSQKDAPKKCRSRDGWVPFAHAFATQTCHRDSAAAELSPERVGANLSGAGALLHFIFSGGGSHG